MKPLSLYEWIAGSMSDFTKPFQDNELLFNQAKAFWINLDSATVVIIAFFVIIGIGMCCYYYKPYNNAPGRRYEPSHWGAFGIATLIFTFLLTLGFEYFAVNPALNGAFMVELKVALGNALYAIVLYVIASVVWCNFLPTNAFRIFKF